MSLLIGVDLGTSGAKSGLFDAHGNLLRLSRWDYPAVSGAETRSAERDPEAWWRAVCHTLREVSRGVPDDEIAALCVEGQGPSVVMVDKECKPLRNAVLWMDPGTSEHREALSKRLGYAVSPFAHVPLAMWLRENDPQAYQQARWFLTAWDFVALRLCGEPAASALAYFQPFPPEEVAAAELPDRLFPPTVPAGQPIADLVSTAEQDTGLPAGLPVVAGAHDGIATFIGAGLAEVGLAADVNGTSGGLALCWDSPLDRPGIFSEPWIEPDLYISGGAMASLGQSLHWVRNLIAGTGISYEDLIEEAMQVPAGAEGLVFLPYLAGERSPIWDPHARGVFFGLSLSHDHRHLVRAVLESAAYALRHVVEELVGAGARIDEMRVCGRQSLSDAWNQIKADVIGVPVAVPRVREAALMGAAILAGIGAGQLQDIADGAGRMVYIDGILEPNPDRHRLYSELFDVYKRLYPDLRESFHQLSSVARAEEGDSASSSAGEREDNAHDL